MKFSQMTRNLTNYFSDLQKNVDSVKIVSRENVCLSGIIINLLLRNQKEIQIVFFVIKLDTRNEYNWLNKFL